MITSIGVTGVGTANPLGSLDPSSFVLCVCALQMCACYTSLSQGCWEERSAANMITSAVYPSTLSIRGYIENWSGVSLPTSTIESAVVEKG